MSSIVDKLRGLLWQLRQQGETGARTHNMGLPPDDTLKDMLFVAEALGRLRATGDLDIAKKEALNKLWKTSNKRLRADLHAIALDVVNDNTISAIRAIQTVFNCELLQARSMYIDIKDRVAMTVAEVERHLYREYRERKLSIFI